MRPIAFYEVGAFGSIGSGRFCSTVCGPVQQSSTVCNADISCAVPGATLCPHMRGQHKPDCTCGWCETRRKNLAKKNAVSSGSSGEAKETPVSDPPKNDSGDVSGASLPPNSEPADMAAKIAAMNAAKAGKNAAAAKSHEKPISRAQPSASAADATQDATAEPKKGWFETLFSGFGTLLDD